MVVGRRVGKGDEGKGRGERKTVREGSKSNEERYQVRNGG